MKQIEVTVPLTLAASLTFVVDEGVVVTPDVIAGHVAKAQRLMDRGDIGGGVYWTVQSQGEPVFEEWPAEFVL